MRRHLRHLKLPAAGLWRPPGQALLHRPPSWAAQWLSDPGSVTQNLIDRYGAVEVEVLGQAWGHPSLNESRAIGIAPRRLAIVRRVALRCAAQWRVLARTVMPQSALQGRFRKLGRLGNRPLGHLLFTDPAIHRLGYEIAHLPQRHWLFPELTDAAWGRRSAFAVGNGVIVVYEVFLPALLEQSEQVTREAA